MKLPSKGYLIAMKNLDIYNDFCLRYYEYINIHDYIGYNDRVYNDRIIVTDRSD